MKALFLVPLLILLAGPQSIQGQTIRVWSGTGGSTSWNTSTNWGPNGAPNGSSFVAQFGAITNTSNTTGIPGTTWAVGAVEMTSDRANPMTVGASGISNAVLNLTLAGQTVNLISNVVVRNNSSQNLTFQSNNGQGTPNALQLVLGNATENIVQIDGSGNVQMNVPITGGGSLTVQGGGSGALILSGVAGANTYSGATTIKNGGRLRLIANSTPGDTTAGTVVNAGGIIELGGTLVGNEALTLNGTGKLVGSATSSWAGTVTVNNSVFEILSGTTTLTGQITGPGGITKLGAGTLELANTPPSANNFSGPVVVEAGSLLLNRSAANTSIPESSLSPIVVQTGGTLLLGQSDQIGDTRSLHLTGGTFNSGGNNEILGSLTLTGNSVIDFGTGPGSVVAFANSIGNLWTGTLSIWNWSGTPITGGGIDQLLFGPGGLSNTQASQIAFYSGANTGFVGTGVLLGSGEVAPGIVPVPEPTGVLSTLLLLTLVGWRERGLVLRRKNRKLLIRQSYDIECCL